MLNGSLLNICHLRSQDFMIQNKGEDLFKFFQIKTTQNIEDKVLRLLQIRTKGRTFLLSQAFIIGKTQNILSHFKVQAFKLSQIATRRTFSLLQVFTNRNNTYSQSLTRLSHMNHNKWEDVSHYLRLDHISEQHKFTKLDQALMNRNKGEDIFITSSSHRSKETRSEKIRCRI